MGNECCTEGKTAIRRKRKCNNTSVDCSVSVTGSSPGASDETKESTNNSDKSPVETGILEMSPPQWNIDFGALEISPIEASAGRFNKWK